MEAKNKLKGKDFLGVKDISTDDMNLVLETALSMREILSRPIKVVPTLRGKRVVNLFYEPSTRTRTSFEIAAKSLSADVSSIAVAASSVVKGESLKDTVKTLESLGCDVLVIRHKAAGAPHLAARWTKANVINAGDGLNQHPTQALLDLFTLQQAGKTIKGLNVLIAGDIYHSRVARSDIFAFNKLGAKVKLCAPQTLIPSAIEKFKVQVFNNFEEALENTDAIIMLRVQLERQGGGFFPSKTEYADYYCLTKERLKIANKGCVVMHPGPINRGIEISAEVADGENVLITNQVTSGVAVRMALLYLLAP